MHYYLIFLFIEKKEKAACQDSQKFGTCRFQSSFPFHQFQWTGFSSCKHGAIKLKLPLQIEYVPFDHRIYFEKRIVLAVRLSSRDWGWLIKRGFWIELTWISFQTTHKTWGFYSWRVRYSYPPGLLCLQRWKRYEFLSKMVTMLHDTYHLRANCPFKYHL